MSRGYSTEAIVLGSHKLREADRVVNLFTSARGKTPTVVKGVRKVGSRFGGRLEPFTHLEVQLHEGRTLHTLTGADTVRTHAAIRGQPAALKAGLSFIDLLSRTGAELERRPRCFNLLVRFLDEMEKVVSAGTADGAGETGSAPGLHDGRSADDVDGAAGVNRPAVLALGAELKLLLLSGYLPHLSSCAHCGSEESLPRFSAMAGGALCADCPGESFPVSAAALEAMRFLLESPLAAAAGRRLDAAAERETWRAVREVCRYHLGFDPRVAPV